MITRIEGLEILTPSLNKTLKQHYKSFRLFKEAVIKQLLLENVGEDLIKIQNKQGHSIQDGW